MGDNRVLGKPQRRGKNDGPRAGGDPDAFLKERSACLSRDCELRYTGRQTDRQTAFGTLLKNEPGPVAPAPSFQALPLRADNRGPSLSSCLLTSTARSRHPATLALRSFRLSGSPKAFYARTLTAPHLSW